MEDETIIAVSVLGGALAVVCIFVIVLCCQVCGLRKRLLELEGVPRVRVQKLTVDPNEPKNHAFHNPAISPNEELSKRGYSMYMGDDVESQRGTERQTGGQFVTELSRELESRQERQAAPPFLLQSIEHNKRITRELAKQQAASQDNHTRQSETNPNFIY